MRKLLFSTLFCFVALALPAQQISLSAKAGLNMTKMDYSGFTLDELYVTGGHAGLSSEMCLAGKLGLLSSLSWTTKGGRLNGFTIDAGRYDEVVRLNYLQLVSGLAFLGKHFYVAFGPYLGYCLGGTVKTVVGEYDSTRNPQIGTDQFQDYQPADWGLSAEAALKLKKWRLSLGLAYGLANTIPTRQGFGDSPSARHLGAQVGLGYVFYEK
ncbi:MAG: PorT family protein [Saprospiraceae bacterium]|nr:PorT family protein [Saprospiraceae bacterium]